MTHTSSPGLHTKTVIYRSSCVMWLSRHTGTQEPTQPTLKRRHIYKKAWHSYSYQIRKIPPRLSKVVLLSELLWTPWPRSHLLEGGLRLRVSDMVLKEVIRVFYSGLELRVLEVGETRVDILTSYLRHKVSLCTNENFSMFRHFWRVKAVVDMTT